MKIEASTLKFLSDLKKNNTREWFEKNKDRYLDAKKNVEGFADHLIQLMSKKDDRLKQLKAKDCMFRIHRDVRFSKNKSPYKTSFGIVVGKNGRKTTEAGFYLHIEPGKGMIAGGIWMPEPKTLYKIRQEIEYNHKAFLKILKEKKFVARFKKMDEEKLKRPPKGFDAEHEAIELIKHTSFVVTCKVSDTQLLAKNLDAQCVKVKSDMNSFCNFLSSALH
ncbi:MAG TPA: DUF2461 domain-containing protein [Bacteroidia bacterium]|nr:DUF2461 domain-containing protein [Bacteroidia bacterium]HNT79293.1 DUF2461 domain-containing protein [Bacteroidia bacterium]